MKTRIKSWFTTILGSLVIIATITLFFMDKIDVSVGALLFGGGVSLIGYKESLFKKKQP
jgi:hypothetical protein